MRRADGTLVVAAGDHATEQGACRRPAPPVEQIVVPIFANKARWGQLEMAFQPTGVPSAFGMEMPWLYLAGFMLLACFTSFYLPRAHAAPPRPVAGGAGLRALPSTRSPRACW
ncbi:MAG: hypothetical protein U1F45_02035 [Burkholderiales bacterium]